MFFVPNNFKNSIQLNFVFAEQLITHDELIIFHHPHFTKAQHFAGVMHIADRKANQSKFDEKISLSLQLIDQANFDLRYGTTTSLIYAII
jgi:hypothetical protein